MSTSILLVEDDATLRGALAETLSLAHYDVHEAGDGRRALDILSSEDIAAVVSDYQMAPMNGSELLAKLREMRPDLPFLLMTAYGTIQHAVKSIQQGATDYLVKPFDAPTLLSKLERVIPNSEPPRDMIAIDAASRRVKSFAERVAPTDSTVLITGESGTGKEVFARHIHRCSKRSDQPFVAVNCAAIPENMLESLLFGHEKGAFTGAHVARAGKFELAQHGTLLLDEISEIDLGLQAKLLRVLQEREVERVGARSPVKLDVRVLATTNRDLGDCVRHGKFREDLFYRLSVFPLHLPPLRNRVGDILPLARHFLRSVCKGARPVPSLTDEASEMLLRHAWPGNVRELGNLIERALILTDGNEIRPCDLQFEGHALELEDDANHCPTATGASKLRSNLRSVEEQLVLDALEQCRGSRQDTARKLGISARTLRYKLAKLRRQGVEIPSDIGRRPVTGGEHHGDDRD
jgi:two-component system, response regulator FlrC